MAAVENVIFNGAAVAWVQPLVKDGDDIDSLGTLISVKTPQDGCKIVLPASAEASDPAKVEVALNDGTILQTDANEKRVNLKDGSVGSSAAGNEQYAEITISMAEATKANVDAIQQHDGPYLIVMPWGDRYDSGGNKIVDGYIAIIGKRTNRIEVSPQANSAMQLSLTFNGGLFTATASGDTALAHQPAAITAHNGASYQPEAITSQEVTDMKNGKYVLKDAA